MDSVPLESNEVDPAPAVRPVATKEYAVGEGWCPLKRDVIMSKEDYLRIVAERDARTALVTGIIPDNDDKMGNKRKRGQNKCRSAEDMGMGIGKLNRVCRSVLPGSSAVCTYGESCRDSHDLKGFLAARPPDISSVCPVFSACGWCSSGVACLWSRGHTDAETGVQLRDEKISKSYLPESNTLPPETSKLLQRGRYIFFEAPCNLSSSSSGVQQWSAGKSGKVGEKSNVQPEHNTPVSSKLTGEKDALEAKNSIPASTDSARQTKREKTAVKKNLDLKGKLVIAPLTTLGNLPFRRIMKKFGADVTIGEMALATNLLQGSHSEWALVRRHPSEDCFGVQLAGNNPEIMARVCEVFERENMEFDFVDINCGCPLDLVCNKGLGAACMAKPTRLRECVLAMDSILRCPVTMKIRTGLDKQEAARFAHKLVGKVRLWSAAGSANQFSPLDTVSSATRRSAVAAITVHGRTRQQRYSSYADWGYIDSCLSAASSPQQMESPLHLYEAGYRNFTSGSVLESWGLLPNCEATRTLAQYEQAIQSNNGTRISGALGLAEVALNPPKIPIVGNGDILSRQDWADHLGAVRKGGGEGLTTCMLARGVLIKPWLPTEIKEGRDWDISSSERLEILRKFTDYGLEHWGSDAAGVAKTRKFLLEWLAYLHRYVPIALLERLPQKMGDKAPAFWGRNDLETLMASNAAEDWVKISEMLLGPVPAGFKFLAKHKSNGAAGSNEGEG